MVAEKRYMPTNKRFQDHTKMFVGTKTKKGHLGGGDKEKEKTLTEGTLVKIIKNKLYEDGWEVRIGKGKDAKTYMCSYGDNIMYLPPNNETELYYVPKHECSVQVSIDTKTKLYFITRINDPNKQPISMTANKINIQGSGTTALEITTNVVKAYSNLVSNEDVIANTNDKSVSLIQVDSQVTSMKENGIKTKGDVVSTQNEVSVSLIDTHNQLDSIYNNGLETNGDLVVYQTQTTSSNETEQSSENTEQTSENTEQTSEEQTETQEPQVLKVSLLEINNKINSLYTDGLKTNGDFIIYKVIEKEETESEEGENTEEQTNTEEGTEEETKEEIIEISVLELYDKINELEEKIKQLEQEDDG